MGLKLGTNYRYMVLDVSDPRHSWVRSPVQDPTCPLFLGGGPEVPSGTFTVGEGTAYETVEVTGTDDPINPFPVPIVVAHRVI